MKNIVKIWSKNTIEENKTFDNIPIKLKKYIKNGLLNVSFIIQNEKKNFRKLLFKIGGKYGIN